VVAGQGGYFTAAQARELGYSYQAQAHHVGAGNWIRVDRGVFRLAEWVPDVHDDLVRWSLWSRGQGVVSHESALSVHGVGELEVSKVQLTVPPRFRPRDPAVVLHFAALPEKDVLQRAGFRVTTVARALIDVASAGVEEDQLARAIRDACDGGLLTIRQLRARAESVDVRGALYIERALQLTASA
jgi:predicted transcriptional regulator of viral defense system